MNTVGATGNAVVAGAVWESPCSVAGPLLTAHARIAARGMFETPVYAVAGPAEPGSVHRTSARPAVVVVDCWVSSVPSTVDQWTVAPVTGRPA
jgi:hypothetical protein